MAVEANAVASLLEKLKVDDPWVPPKPWESIPSESGSFRSHSHPRSSHSLYHTSSVSEPSLVRLVMNALQGVESALIAIDKLSALFCSDSADRTFHRISSLWTWSSSTLSLGNVLKSIGQLGCIVLLLHKFVDYFVHLKADGNSGYDENSNKNSEESEQWQKFEGSLVNQAFAVAVKKVLHSFTSTLNTLSASAKLRRTSNTTDEGYLMDIGDDGGCLMDVGNAEVTFLEVYLHTKGLRTQIEALGNICRMNDIANDFSVSSFEVLRAKASQEFATFPRGGALLTFLYMQLKVVDPVHCDLLKFLFLQSCEPYYGFIKSWIYEGKISDPYKEFVVEYVEKRPADAWADVGISIEFPLNTFRVRDGVALPCFLEEFLIPLLRAGQQLQAVMKLLELCNNHGTHNNIHEEILPSFDGFSSQLPFSASALTFQKGIIQNMTLARNSYYKRILEKVESILMKYEFRSQQVSQLSIQNFHTMDSGRNSMHFDPAVDDCLIPPVIDQKKHNLTVNTTDNEASSSADEFLYNEDILEPSECSSDNSFEEQNESELMCNIKTQIEPSYLSSLSFSINFSDDNPGQKPSHIEISNSSRSFSSETCERTVKHPPAIDSCHEATYMSESFLPLHIGEPKLLQNYYTSSTDSGHSAGLLFGCTSDNPAYENGIKNRLMQLHLTDHRPKVKGENLEFWKTEVLHCHDTISPRTALMQMNSNMDQQPVGSCAISNSCSQQSWNLKYSSSIFSTNPVLSTVFFFNYGRKPGERHSMNYFDFTSVRDPCKVVEEKLASHSSHQFGAERRYFPAMDATAATNVIDCHSEEIYSKENSEGKINSSHFHLSSDLTDVSQEEILPANVTGGSHWETLLACFGDTSDVTSRDYNTISASVFEMPLDYVIKKCLWEEILFQYSYVSKLTIKLLEDGFDLQEHLLALCRYHFMELADWADLFIMSLWNHKWYVVEAEKRIPEIQGVLELSVQRSSCERDPYKDRLYVYMKGDCVRPAFANGVHAFDFLGLGYQVDWPVSIILSTGALKIYSDIFNFLIQVKLAVFCLNDVWCSLKDLVQFTVRCRRSELPKPALYHISVLTETRHQLNHFVSALQHYVQSQLSRVSRCKYLNSLEHKVKDMMDLEAVHIAFLNESVQICFLSDETQSVSSIIQSILQCAVDFQSCLIGYDLEVGPNGKDSLGELSRIDIVQVLAIKKTLAKNINDLFSCYLKSPKHSEYGLSRFWDNLNYNDYYSEVIRKELGPRVLPIQDS